MVFRVTRECEGRAVKSIMEHELHMSGALISDVKMRERGIMLNDARVFVTARVHEGDVLTVEVGDKPGACGYIRPMEFALNVAYEDDDLIIIDKPAGMTVHQSKRDENELTVENALRAHLGDCGIHPVSRLDRCTTGLMTVAKSAYSCELLRRMLHTPDFFREYIAVAVGRVFPTTGSVALPLGFADGSTYKHAVRADGAPSLTEYEVIAQNDQLSLVRLVPRTGRTHQLRIHMAALGFPLAGDWLYGTENDGFAQRCMLHSHKLHLVHPITGAPLDIEAPPPADMQKLINIIRA